jgi:uncharacterized protein YqjF (DUF2071 family)
MIDRLAPSRRPSEPAAGTQKWRDLLFVHWAVPIAALLPLVPKGLEIDVLDGVAFVGVVPFSMHEVRPKYLPRFAAFDFLETNVRTYVLSGDQPGVFFFSLEAASWLACAAARATFGLPYFPAKMTMRKNGGVVDYETRRRLGGAASSRFRVRVGESMGASAPATLEHFLVERYYLFVDRGGEILRGQVHHRPYPVHRAELLEVHDELVAAAGIAGPLGAPKHVHWSPGVDVEVFALRPSKG